MLQVFIPLQVILYVQWEKKKKQQRTSRKKGEIGCPLCRHSSLYRNIYIYIFTFADFYIYFLQNLQKYHDLDTNTIDTYYMNLVLL